MKMLILDEADEMLNKGTVYHMVEMFVDFVLNIIRKLKLQPQ